MTSRTSSTGPARFLLSLLATVLAASSCGLPGSGSARVVDDADVPYALLAPSDPVSPSTTADAAPARTPTVFWVEGAHLVPEATTEPCSEDPHEVVSRLLATLMAGPTEEARGAGKSSAVPAEFALALLSIDGHTATVGIEPGTSVSAERLPFAVGQIVLTVTSAPSVESVVLVNDGEPVQVPLPDGALTSRAATAQAYVELLPDRFRSSGHIGCPRR